MAWNSDTNNTKIVTASNMSFENKMPNNYFLELFQLHRSRHR
jgi:hypothetical protein